MFEDLRRCMGFDQSTVSVDQTVFCTIAQQAFDVAFNRPAISASSHNADLNAIQHSKDLYTFVSCLMPSRGSVIMCGDFNLPDIDWSVDKSLNCYNGTCTGIFLDFCYNFGLHQLVNSPTRADNILNLVLGNDYACILNVKVSEPFSTSDHFQVRFDRRGSWIF
jgi:hypothetical protein